MFFIFSSERALRHAAPGGRRVHACVRTRTCHMRAQQGFSFLFYACRVSFMLHGMRWRSLRRFVMIADFGSSQKRHMRPPAVAMMHAYHVCIFFYVMNDAHAACQAVLARVERAWGRDPSRARQCTALLGSIDACVSACVCA